MVADRTPDSLYLRVETMADRKFLDLILQLLEECCEDFYGAD